MGFLREDETLEDLQLNGLKLIQKKDGFRFGVDAVLLANFAKVKKNGTVIDLCSGTGIIPFILAGKTEAKKITGIEIQEDMVEMAKRSVEFNNLNERVQFINKDLKDNKGMKSLDKVDVVTVNPPYKLANSGILNPKDKMAIARHEVCCTLEDVIKTSRTLLKDNGRLFMVHRPERLVDILSLMREYKIEPKRIRMVHPNVKKAPNIVLIEGQRDGGKFFKWEDPLYVHNEDGSYTKEINDIYNSIS
ncbi:tRNA1(Val) (adenine(37)-N6)-methyltransferase [Hathewaya massiliensis]|uniref:tRNA1(Val) (adenine(37)-N6)-methyltransferase n=1 Tax=Hathewaya massiliensis TaxID=1964382 RepID=UPI00115B6C2D|nr:tRNA1(Val) (adenine(37)-N6)-methyltransferase [Hathewaya massiliensis]